ncbi:hypothetical protein JTE90_028541 [Oedothorax gibbosus]|uniref:FHA domain-containing protein n=1 Tax=Oedothorax gibbosus TaxID=931172 RepID=A0AAV6VUJ9_9ARAC|nr:hypothetical protein JTE90_028541 [Oedothorax gibbosus]
MENYAYYLRQLTETDFTLVNIPLDKNVTVIGKDYFPSLRIYPTLSSQHAKLTRTALREWCLEDLGSKCGTYVNKRNIGSNKTTVLIGDQIGFGVKYAQNGFMCAVSAKPIRIKQEHQVAFDPSIIKTETPDTLPAMETQEKLSYSYTGEPASKLMKIDKSNQEETKYKPSKEDISKASSLHQTSVREKSRSFETSSASSSNQLNSVNDQYNSLKSIKCDSHKPINTNNSPVSAFPLKSAKIQSENVESSSNALHFVVKKEPNTSDALNFTVKKDCNAFHESSYDDDVLVILDNGCHSYSRNEEVIDISDDETENELSSDFQQNSSENRSHFNKNKTESYTLLNSIDFSNLNPLCDQSSDNHSSVTAHTNELNHQPPSNNYEYSVEPYHLSPRKISKDASDNESNSSISSHDEICYASWLKKDKDISQDAPSNSNEATSAFGDWVIKGKSKNSKHSAIHHSNVKHKNSNKLSRKKDLKRVIQQLSMEESLEAERHTKRKARKKDSEPGVTLKKEHRNIKQNMSMEKNKPSLVWSTVSKKVRKLKEHSKSAISSTAKPPNCENIIISDPNRGKNKLSAFKIPKKSNKEKKCNAEPAKKTPIVCKQSESRSNFLLSEIPLQRDSRKAAAVHKTNGLKSNIPVKKEGTKSSACVSTKNPALTNTSVQREQKKIEVVKKNYCKNNIQDKSQMDKMSISSSVLSSIEGPTMTTAKKQLAHRSSLDHNNTESSSSSIKKEIINNMSIQKEPKNLDAAFNRNDINDNIQDKSIINNKSLYSFAPYSRKMNTSIKQRRPSVQRSNLVQIKTESNVYPSNYVKSQTNIHLPCQKNNFKHIQHLPSNTFPVKNYVPNSNTNESPMSHFISDENVASTSNTLTNAEILQMQTGYTPVHSLPSHIIDQATVPSTSSTPTLDELPQEEANKSRHTDKNMVHDISREWYQKETTEYNHGPYVPTSLSSVTNEMEIIPSTSSTPTLDEMQQVQTIKEFYHTTSSDTSANAPYSGTLYCEPTSDESKMEVDSHEFFMNCNLNQSCQDEYYQEQFVNSAKLLPTASYKSFPRDDTLNSSTTNELYPEEYASNPERFPKNIYQHRSSTDHSEKTIEQPLLIEYNHKSLDTKTLSNPKLSDQVPQHLNVNSEQPLSNSPDYVLSLVAGNSANGIPTPTTSGFHHNHTENSMWGSNQISIESFIQKIVEFNYKWLEQQKYNNKPPPAVSEGARKLPLCFNSFDEYVSFFYPMLMLELWETLYLEAKKLWEDPQMRDNEFFFQILRAENLLSFTKFHCVTPAEIGSFCPRKGDVILMHIQESKTRQRHIILGYIVEDFIREVLNTSGNVKRVHQFNVLVKTRNFFPKLTTNFKANGICSVLKYLSMLEALMKLGNSSLLQSILLPKFDSFRNDLLPLNIQSICNMMGKNCSTSNIIMLRRYPINHILLSLLEKLLQMEVSEYKILLMANSNEAINEIGLFLLQLNTAHKRDNKFVIVNSSKAVLAELREFTLDHFYAEQLQIEDDLKNHKLELSKLFREKITTNSNSNRIENLINIVRAKEKKLLFKNSKKERNKFQLLHNYTVTLTTLKDCCKLGLIPTSLSNSNPFFSCCIIEEATQFTELELLQSARFAKHLVLLGDPEKSANVLSKMAYDCGFNRSMFNRFLEFHPVPEFSYFNAG